MRGGAGDNRNVAETDYQRLATPLGGDAPTGVDLREDSEGVQLYRRIKDARSAARAEDRSAEAYVVDAGDEDETVRRPSERWRDVHDLAFEALDTRTKDIELFAWLAEAAIRMRGLRALGAVVASMREMIVDHYDAIHSIDDETPADKAIPLAGLNGAQDSDGTLIRPLRLCSLLPGQLYGRFSLWEHAVAQRAADGAETMGAFGDAIRDTDPGDLTAMRLNVEGLNADFAAIDAHLTVVCGAEAPSLRRIRDVLDDMMRAYNELGVVGGEPAAAAAEAGEVEADGANGAAPTAAAPSGPARPKTIETREEAFTVLLQVAAFFRRTEPHSPIPPAIETIVRRGRMDFAGLLAELIPDEHQRREMLTRAGIEPNTVIQQQ